MMRNKYIRMVSVLLIAVTLLGVMLGIGSSGANIDYSRPGTSLTTSVYAGDVLSELGYEVSNWEREYLELYHDFSITHGSNISTSYVKTEYNEADGILLVSVKPQSYLLGDGTQVDWIPKTASYHGTEKELVKEDAEYFASFTDVLPSDDNTVKVAFEYDIELSFDTVNAFINKAYFDAPTVKANHLKAEEDYQKALEAYRKNEAEYNLYVEAMNQYLLDLESYRVYVEQKRIFDEQLSAYNEYLRESLEFEEESKKYSEYEKALAQYKTDYDSYLKYLANADEYDAKVLAYQKYLAEMETVRAQLKIIEQTKQTVTSLKRSTFSDIMGTTVTTVIENKDLLTKPPVSASADAVDRAGLATENLRVLLTDYFACKTESEKYAYYSLNYENFRDNFAELLRSLDKLYTKKVRGILIQQDKNEKYVILIAQLYYIVNALSDKPVQNYDKTAYFDSSYVIGAAFSDAKKPSRVITEKGYYVDSGRAAPLENGYPNEVAEPEKLVVTKPTQPAYMQKPVAPEKVDPPTVKEPDEVKEPKKPAEVVKLPLPEEYKPSSAILNLISEYDAGNIKLRDEITANAVITRRILVEKTFIGATEVNVVFHDNNGNEIYETTADKGTYADFVGVIPTKEEDVSGTYEFIGWADDQGNLIDLSKVEEDLNLYPKYKKTLKKYTVTWIINGEEIEEIYEYGTAPVCPVSPSKPGTDDTYFVFKGFDSEITEVLGNTKYTAIFQEKYLLPFGESYGASISYTDEICTVNALQSSSHKFDISKLLEKISGRMSLKILTRFGTLNFSFDDTMKMTRLSVKYVSISVKRMGSGAYTYSLAVSRENGEPVAEQIKAQVVLPCNFDDTNNMVLCYSAGDTYVPVKHSNENGNVHFTAVAGRNYRAVLEYTATVIENGAIKLTIDKSVAMLGSVIYAEYSVPPGVEIVGTYYITESGQKIYFKNYFNITENVSVGIDFKYLEFTVKFVSDGKVINSAIYHYGDMPKVPSNPQKASDDKYHYNFVGWSAEIVPVTEDAVYEAEYWCDPVIPKPAPTGPMISDSVMRLLLLGGSAAFVLLFGAVPCIILSVKFAKKRSKSGTNN